MVTNLEIKTSNQTTSAVYADAIAIRKAVFIQEQHIDPVLELDTVTDATWHYVLYDEAGQAVATARMTPETGGKQHIQRVATLKTARGHGYAQAIIREMIVDARSHGDRQLVLGAQVTAQSFYTQLGFVPQGEQFMEAGLAHQEMAMTL